MNPHDEAHLLDGEDDDFVDEFHFWDQSDSEELEVREPHKRVIVVFGRWDLPVARKGYTYETDLPLAVGDIVIVPPTAIRDEESEATVVQLGSEYTGWVAKIEKMAGDFDGIESSGLHSWHCQCRGCNEGEEGVEVR